MKKKRAPHDKLIQAGKDARALLAKRGAIAPDDKSIITKIVQTKGAPILPGIPPYLPRPWTLNATKRIIYDFGRAWQKEIRDDDKRKENGLEFFKFVIEGMNRPESVVNSLIAKTIEKKEYEQKYLSRKETIDALKRFLIDSFAISVIVKSHTETSDYLEWFYEWSGKLLLYWPTSLQMIDAKKDGKGHNNKNTSKS